MVDNAALVGYLFETRIRMKAAKYHPPEYQQLSTVTKPLFLYNQKQITKDEAVSSLNEVIASDFKLLVPTPVGTFFLLL